MKPEVHGIWLSPLRGPEKELPQPRIWDWLMAQRPCPLQGFCCSSHIPLYGCQSRGVKGRQVTLGEKQGEDTAVTGQVSGHLKQNTQFNIGSKLLM